MRELRLHRRRFDILAAEFGVGVDVRRISIKRGARVAANSLMRESMNLVGECGTSCSQLG